MKNRKILLIREVHWSGSVIKEREVPWKVFAWAYWFAAFSGAGFGFALAKCVFLLVAWHHTGRL